MDCIDSPDDVGADSHWKWMSRRGDDAQPLELFARETIQLSMGSPAGEGTARRVIPLTQNV